MNTRNRWRCHRDQQDGKVHRDHIYLQVHLALQNLPGEPGMDAEGELGPHGNVMDIQVQSRTTGSTSDTRLDGFRRINLKSVAFTSTGPSCSEIECNQRMSDCSVTQTGVSLTIDRWDVERPLLLCRRVRFIGTINQRRRLRHGSSKMHRRCIRY